MAWPAAAGAVSIPADEGTLGAIPDGFGNSCTAVIDDGVFVMFDTSEVDSVEGVSVDVTLNHPYAGDLQIMLLGHGDSVVLAEPGECSENGLLAGTYTFADGGSSWQDALDTAGDSDVLPTVTYAPADGESINGTLASKNPGNLWELWVFDGWMGDVGSVDGATLHLEPNAKPKVKANVKVKQKQRKAQLKFTASDNVSTGNALAVTCKLDKKKFKKCKSPVTYKRLKPGKHKVSVRAVDEAGNKATANKSFKIKKPKKKK